MPQGLYSPNTVWVRGKNNKNIRHITLRDNITPTVDNEGNDIYTWDEVDIYLVDREDLLTFVSNNFSSLFTKGKETKIQEEILKLKVECTSNIEKGFTSSCTGEEKEFGSNKHDQLNILRLALLADSQTGTVTYNGLELTSEQVNSLANDMDVHINSELDAYNQKKTILLS